MPAVCTYGAFRTKVRFPWSSDERREHPVEEVEGAEIPPMARIHSSVTCDGCKELATETRVRRLEGKKLCPACFEAAVPAEE